MIVDYSPGGGAKQTFQFRPGRLRLRESAQIEFRYSKESGEKGCTYQQFVEDVKKGSAVARRVLLHHLLRRQHPTIRIEDVDPFEDELEVQFHRDELEDLRAAMEKATNLTPQEKEGLLARMDEEIAGAPEYEGPGKADGSSTSEPDL